MKSRKSRGLTPNLQKNFCNFRESDPRNELKGELKPWDDSLPLNISIRKFIIRNDNDNSTAVFIIDKEGNLYLKGLVYIHSLL